MDEEFINILRNLGTKWYKCPNGHAYTIGECGLPMEESICPECKEKIGGRDHVPLKSNKMVDFEKEVKNDIINNNHNYKTINNKNEEEKDINNDNKNKNKENKEENL